MFSDCVGWKWVYRWRSRRILVENERRGPKRANPGGGLKRRGNGVARKCQDIGVSADI